MQPALIVDAHEDIAYNMLTFGRDYTRSAAETRQIETASGSQALEHNGQTVLGWPDYQRGRVADRLQHVVRHAPAPQDRQLGYPSLRRL